MSTISSNGKTVLISGINGYIASAIGLELLKKGYNLRGTSRSASSAVGLLQCVYKEYMDAGRFDMVIIEDMTIPSAFDEAVKGEPGGFPYNLDCLLYRQRLTFHARRRTYNYSHGIPN